MTWPSYRNRYLPAMTLRQIQALPQKADALVVLSTGAIEQHGPHLPVGVDALLGQMFLNRALLLLDSALSVYCAPPIQVAKSNEHDGFPGTLILSRERLRHQIAAVGRQLTDWGFRRLAILNTHGGNLSVVKSSLRELHMKLGMEVHLIYAPYPIEVSEREAAFGIHANNLESSLMYHATPNMVDPKMATCCWSGSLEDSRILKSQQAPATYAWKTLDISRSGTIGDATGATAEQGAVWLQRAADALAAELRALAG